MYSTYGSIWEKNGEFLAYTVVEEYYNYEAIAFFLFDRLPYGKKLDHVEYTQTIEAIMQVFAGHDLVCTNFIYYADKAFTFWGNNRELDCMLIIKRHSLTFYCSTREPLENGMTKIIPQYTRKQRILLRDLSSVKYAVERCFLAE